MRLVRAASAAVMLVLLLAGSAMAGLIEANLSVAKTDSPDPVLAGANVTYTLTVQNAGPQSASNVELSDPLPAGTSFVSLTSPVGWAATTPPVGGTGTVTATIASLTVAAGAQVFTLVVQVAPSTPNGTVLTNVATVESATIDPVLTNNSSTATTTVAAAAASVPNAAMPETRPGNPIATLGFAVLLIGLLTASAVMAARRVRT